MYYAYYKVKLHRYYEGILTSYLSLHALDQPNKLQLLHESVYLHAYWWWEPWGGQEKFSPNFTNRKYLNGSAVV